MADIPSLALEAPNFIEGLMDLNSQTLVFLRETVSQMKETTWDVWSKYHIPNLLQLIAICVGIVMVNIQIRKQHKSTLEIQDEKIRFDLRLQLRQEIEVIIDSLNSLTAVSSNFPASLNMSLIVAKAEAQSGREYRPLPQRVPKFNQDNYTIQNEVANLIGLIEKYEIVMPELKVFQWAMNVFSNDFRDASNEYMRTLLEVLPFDASDEHRTKTGISVFNRPLPTPDQEKKLEVLGAAYSAPLHDLGGWLMDLRTVIQSLALGKLFPEHKTHARQPIDPEVIVITGEAENIIKVTAYFENHTRWGREQKEIKEQVKARFSTKNASK